MSMTPRSRECKDLRELHKLYNKCEPALLINWIGLPELAMCACGRILKRPGQTNWSWSATLSHQEGWVPTTHQDRKAIRKRPEYAKRLKQLQQGKEGGHTV
jgi:hypothetical protein